MKASAMVLAILLAITALPAYEPTQVKMEVGVEWITNLEEAKLVSREKNLPIFLLFTGSDWCLWCIHLRQEVLYQKEFIDYLNGNFVPVMVDFPKRKPLPDDVMTYNHELMKKYDIQAFPTVLILDTKGDKKAVTGYRSGGASLYIEHLEAVKQKLSQSRSTDSDKGARL